MQLASSLRALPIALAVLLPVFAACDDTDGNGGDGGSGGSGGAGSTTTTGTSTGTTSTGTTSTGTTGSTGTTSTTTSGSGGAGAGVAQLCVDTINQHRASIGLGPLARWTDGEVCADGEAESDGNTNTPHGAFGSCSEFAQNECPGWPGPAEGMIGSCLQLMWDEGPGADYATHGHYINMTNPNYSMVSCGFHTFPDGSVWAVQNFR
jgi:hypothetical protein